MTEGTHKLAKASKSRPPSYFSGSPPSGPNHFKAITASGQDATRTETSTRTREASHAVLLTEWTSSTVRINLGDDDLVLCVCEGVRKLLVNWCEVLCAQQHQSGKVGDVARSAGYGTLQCPHHGAKLKHAAAAFSVASHIPRVRNTYNSTSAGLPLPIISSKLSGFSSRTLDASAEPTDRTAAKKVPNRMSPANETKPERGVVVVGEKERSW